MTNPWRVLRRRVLTPNVSQTRLSVRGFYEKNPEARELLESIGKTFLTGYAYAAEAGTPAEAGGRLEQVPSKYRGWSYEGATMAFAIRDGLPFGKSSNVSRFMAGPAVNQIYIAYVGVGWAMARLPRFRWSALSAPDPLLRWLVLDGYGFHQAYFRTGKYVHRQHRESDFPWPADGPAWYASRVIDQGIGRALWFVCGTDVDRVAATIGAFAESRRADMYSGVGLAATYACGVSEQELAALVRHAGDYRPQLAQGGAFGATARVESGIAVPETAMATRALCGMEPEEAAQICANARVAAAPDGDVPAYETWRRLITAEIVRGGVARS